MADANIGMENVRFEDRKEQNVGAWDFCRAQRLSGWVYKCKGIR